MEKQLKVVSLFSGYGTQELALKYSDINYLNVANCDISKSANIAYESLHKTELGNLGDISKIDETNYEINFSKSGSYDKFIEESFNIDE